MIKVGVIGHGYSAKTFHIPLITHCEYTELTAISSSQVNVIKNSYEKVNIYRTAEELIAKSDVDLAVITAPNSLHYSLAMACLEQGIHVVVEKPMVTSSCEAEQLVKFANSQSLILSVFQNRRWDGDFLTVKKLIDNNTLGDIRFFESHFDRFRPSVRKRWKEDPGPGAGVWFDLGAHLVDQTVCLFGLPQAITGRCLKTREDSQTTDYFHVLLHYDNLEVILHGSSFSAGPNRRFHLEGTRGSFDKYGLDPQEQQLVQGISNNDPTFGCESAENFGSMFIDNQCIGIETEKGNYKHYYHTLSKAINGDGENPVDPVDAITVLKIIELAECSSEEGITMTLDFN